MKIFIIRNTRIKNSKTKIFFEIQVVFFKFIQFNKAYKNNFNKKLLN